MLCENHGLCAQVNVRCVVCRKRRRVALLTLSTHVTRDAPSVTLSEASQVFLSTNLSVLHSSRPVPLRCARRSHGEGRATDLLSVLFAAGSYAGRVCDRRSFVKVRLTFLFSFLMIYVDVLGFKNTTGQFSCARFCWVMERATFRVVRFARAIRS